MRNFALIVIEQQNTDGNFDAEETLDWTCPDGGDGIYDAALKIDGVLRATQKVSIDSGQSQKITLTAAPAIGQVMLVTYARSGVKETDVATAITLADKIIDERISGAGSAANVKTQYWDGDGETITWQNLIDLQHNKSCCLYSICI